jgi:hypothetical protein
MASDCGLPFDSFIRLPNEKFLGPIGRVTSKLLGPQEGSLKFDKDSSMVATVNSMVENIRARPLDCGEVRTELVMEDATKYILQCGLTCDQGTDEYTLTLIDHPMNMSDELLVELLEDLDTPETSPSHGA